MWRARSYGRGYEVFKYRQNSFLVIFVNANISALLYMISPYLPPRTSSVSGGDVRSVLQ